MTSILLVDDHIEIANNIKSLLLQHFKSKEGLVVDTVNDAVSAFMLFQKQRHDISIIDINLEFSVNGIELSRRFKKLKPEIKLILMSATHHDEKIREAAASIGAEFIEKPVKREELLQIISIDNDI